MISGMRSRPLGVGEPAPWFIGRSLNNPRYHFDTVAGRFVVLSFYGSAADPESAALLAAIHAGRARFDDNRLCFFGVSTDPADEAAQRIADVLPGIRHFIDEDRAICAAFGLPLAEGTAHPPRVSYVLDPALRVIAILAEPQGGQAHAAALFALLDRLPPLPAPHRALPQAPVLVVPHVFEPALCKALVQYCETQGAGDSGFMRDVDGKTVGVYDYKHKRRRDCVIADEALLRATHVRIRDRLAPEIHKAFQFEATRIERNIISCYDAEEDAHFARHRDNTTRATAYRRFAVSLFLNSSEYEGGFLRFPEYGSALHSAPTGGAVVFSCSMLHEATRVTRGRRYMYLPFLYDEAASRVREQSQQHLDSETILRLGDSMDAGEGKGAPAPG